MMNEVRPEQLDERVLVLAPTARDAVTSRDLLEAAGVHCTLCGTIKDVCREAGRGAGAAVVTAEAVLGDKGGQLAAWLEAQPPWSDFPLVVLTPVGAESPKFVRALEAVGHMTLMKRPVQVSTLVSTVRSALRDRQRQYAVRDLLAERQRAADALRAERERLRVTLSSIGDAVIATDAEGRVSFMNGVAESLTGWNDAAGHPLTEVFHIVNEQTRLPVENPALRALREGVIVGLANHTVLIASDGAERPIDDSAAPIHDESGIGGAVLVFRDITERRRAEQELRQKQADLTDFIENATVGLHWVGPDGTILWANRAEMELLGYTPEEYVGRNIAEFHADPPVIEDILCRLTNKEHLCGYEARLRCKDGSVKDVLIDSSVLWEGERFVHTRCFTRDITQRKRSEASLRESEERFRTLVTATSDVVYRMSPDWTEMRHLDGREFIADTDEPSRTWLQRYIPTEERPRVMAAITDALQARKAFELEHRVLRVDGAVGWTFSRAIPILDAAGEITEWFGAASDVTRRKQAEEALAWVTEESERRKRLYETILSATPDFVYVFSLDHRILYANDSLVAMWGVGSPVGKTFLEVGYEPWHAEMHGREIDQVRATKQPIRGEVPFDGTLGRRIYDYIFVPVLGADGQVEVVAGTTRDVTDRKLAEEAQARLAAIVESSGDAIISTTLDGVIRSWNAGAERLFGYAAAEAVGRHIILVIPPERHEEDREILERLRRGERVEHFETVRVAKDGRPIDVSLTVSPVHNTQGEVVGASKVARDITARRLAEAALRESEERFRLMADALPVLVWVSDRSKGCTWFNKSWLDFTGRPMQELLGNGWADDVHPDDLGQCMDVYVTSFDARRPFSMDYRLRRHDGEYCWLEDNGVPRFDGQGGFAGYIGSCVDFTDRKRAEEALRQVAADLSEADRKKDDFIALLAHELRNPLAPIRNGLQVLRLAGGDMDAVGQARAMMDRQLSHMVRLIDDLLDVSRISRNKMELRRARVLLADVVANAVETARPMIDASGHELSLSVPPGPVFLDADLTRLAQVVSNLLTNSAKYTGHGGKIRLCAERHAGEVVVTVRDNGIGIPAAALPNIFDMFSQVDRSVERSTGGLGIGLALVKGLVEMHGGTVTAESLGEGKGSTFTVRLPAMAGRAAPAVPGVEEDGPRATGRRILVVDDNRDGADSLAMMLRMMGNEVRTANDGVEAIESADQFHPEVILMDVGMPRLNGLEATRRIRGQEWGRRIIIIALTGWGQNGDKERSREAGCDGHLVKPVNLPDLEKMLAEVSK